MDEFSKITRHGKVEKTIAELSEADRVALELGRKILAEDCKKNGIRSVCKRHKNPLLLILICLILVTCITLLRTKSIIALHN